MSYDWERFDAFYASVEAPAVLDLERRVLGADYGGNSYTDVGQARTLIGLLGLHGRSWLLDIGSGAGWPGLFLAGESGCRAVLTDVPPEGLAAARRRAQRDGIRASPVASSGERLPFREASFDAVSHSDVLC